MKRKSIVAAALVGALTFGSSVGVFASTNSDVSATETTTISSIDTATDDTSSDSTTSTNDTTRKDKHDSSNYKGYGKSSVKSEISTLVDEGYSLEDAKATVLAEKLAEIDAKVTDGTLTSEEAESYKEKITEKINSYTGEETSEDTTDRKYKKKGSKGSKKSSSTESTDGTSSDTTSTTATN